MPHLKPGQKFNVVTIDTLNDYFFGKGVGEKIAFKNIRCDQCGESIDIEIQKTEAGYGFLGGIISQPSEGKILALCTFCDGKRKGK